MGGALSGGPLYCGVGRLVVDCWLGCEAHNCAAGDGFRGGDMFILAVFHLQVVCARFAVGMLAVG